jgi:hypothetical protein
MASPRAPPPALAWSCPRRDPCLRRRLPALPDRRPRKRGEHVAAPKVHWHGVQLDCVFSDFSADEHDAEPWHSAARSASVVERVAGHWHGAARSALVAERVAGELGVVAVMHEITMGLMMA